MFLRSPIHNPSNVAQLAASSCWQTCEKLRVVPANQCMVRQFYSTVQKKGNNFIDFFLGKCCGLCVSYNTKIKFQMPYGTATSVRARYFRTRLATGKRVQTIELRQQRFVCKQLGYSFTFANHVHCLAIDHDFRRARTRVVVGAHAHAICTCRAYGE